MSLASDQAAATETALEARARLDAGRDLSDPRWEENTAALAVAMAQIERAFGKAAPVKLGRAA